MNFIDTHTHLYAWEFDPDRNEMIGRALQKGVSKLLLPAIDISYYERMMQLVSRYPENCFPMIGLHPTSVKADYLDELAFAGQKLEEDPTRFVGIGEIGIDLYWDKTFQAEQENAFSRQLDLAIRYNLPVAIHTRNSFDLALNILQKKNNPSLKGVFHCFGGSVKQAESAVEAGFMLGIGGVITYKNSGLQKVVEIIALERFILETDAPWLPPVPYRGQRNESAYIPVIAEKIAEIKKVTIREVAEITTRNAVTLFKIDT